MREAWPASRTDGDADDDDDRRPAPVPPFRSNRGNLCGLRPDADSSAGALRLEIGAGVGSGSCSSSPMSTSKSISVSERMLVRVDGELVGGSDDEACR